MQGIPTTIKPKALVHQAEINSRSNFVKQRGFTLVELMVVVAIMAVLAAIVVPSYQRFIVKNNEALAQQKMLSLSNELEAWRTKNFSYKGFVPKNGYSNIAQGLINVPQGTNPAYIIQLGQVTKGTFSNFNSDVISKNWVMVAEPQRKDKGTLYFMFSSNGLRCSNNIKVKVTDKDCGVGQQTW